MLVPVILGYGLDDRDGLLGAGGVVQIDQGSTSSQIVQDRELGADRLEVGPGKVWSWGWGGGGWVHRLMQCGDGGSVCSMLKTERPAGSCNDRRSWLVRVALSGLTEAKGPVGPDPDGITRSA
jgi:hypothetical protein